MNKKLQGKDQQRKAMITVRTMAGVGAAAEEKKFMVPLFHIMNSIIALESEQN